MKPKDETTRVKVKKTTHTRLKVKSAQKKIPMMEYVDIISKMDLPKINQNGLPNTKKNILPKILHPKKKYFKNILEESSFIISRFYVGVNLNKMKIIYDTTTKEQRQERSKIKDGKFRKMLRELEIEVAKSYANKAQHDGFYQKIDFKEIVI